MVRNVVRNVEWIIRYSLPMIRVAAVLHLAGQHTGYGNVFFRKTFVDHGTGTDGNTAGDLDFSENLYTGANPYIVAQCGYATGLNILADVHALVDVAEIADAGTGIHHQQAVVVDAQAIAEHVARHTKTQLQAQPVMPPLPVCQRQEPQRIAAMTPAVQIILMMPEGALELPDFTPPRIFYVSASYNIRPRPQHLSGDKSAGLFSFRSSVVMLYRLELSIHIDHFFRPTVDRQQLHVVPPGLLNALPPLGRTPHAEHQLHFVCQILHIASTEKKR